MSHLCRLTRIPPDNGVDDAVINSGHSLSTMVVPMVQQNASRTLVLRAPPPGWKYNYTIITMNNIIYQVPGWQTLFICSHLLKREIDQARSNTLVPSRSSFLVPGRSKPGNSREASAAVWAWIKILTFLGWEAVGSMSQQPNGPMVHHQAGARIKDTLKPFY